MDHEQHDMAATATCTSCQPTEDFSNYWTAVLFFKARNGTYKRVSTVGNGLGYSSANGGQTVYYLSSGKVTAFRPGFRMLVGDPSYTTETEARQNPALQFTCLASPMTRSGYRYDFPTSPCAGGKSTSYAPSTSTFSWPAILGKHKWWLVALWGQI